MLTTFGPSTIEMNKLVTMNKNDLVSTFINNKEDHPGNNDDVEMTFGMIGGSHNGNTSVSNQSLRAS